MLPQESKGSQQATTQEIQKLKLFYLHVFPHGHRAASATMLAAISNFWKTTIFPHIAEFNTKRVRPDIAIVMARASGRVLGIGAGTGANHDLYTSQVTEVVGIEPVAKMVATAKARAAAAPHPYQISFHVGDAQSLPYEDKSFDWCLACLVFCTIPDPEKAAAEAMRVLKPGGKLLFFEHVASHSVFWRTWQMRFDAMWGVVSCGCSLTRDTRSVFEKAGFRYEEIEDRNIALAPRVIRGIAVK